MTFLQFGADLKFGSSDEPCATLKLKSVGELSSECTSSISSALAELIEKALHAFPKAVFISNSRKPKDGFGHGRAKPSGEAIARLPPN